MRAEIAMDGAFGELFDEFVAYKRSIGYGYPDATLILVRSLSRFLLGYPSEQVVTRAAAEEFAARRAGEAVSTWHKRVSMVRQFALFCSLRGIDCFVPPAERAPDRTGFAPKIITEDEMARIITHADTWAAEDTPTDRRPWPVLLRLLWCCGLRLGEALSLTLGDVDLDLGVITVTRAKLNKTRLIPLSGSLGAHLAGYWRDMGFSGSPANVFVFQHHGGKRYAREAAGRRLKMIIAASGVYHDDETKPRVHDVRHSYAVRALQKMDDDGMDIYAGLPLLSTFMGHSDIISTEQYLRLTRHRFGAIEDAMAEAYGGLFPEAAR